MTYPGQEPAAPADDRNSIWVQSDLAPDGSTYVTSIHYDADQSRILTPETAYAYVAEVFRAAVMAEHDAAVIRQLRAMNITLKEAAGIVAELREDRPPLDDAATAPLRLVPGVSLRTGDGFLAVHLGDRQIGEWEPDDARDHATNVLSVQTAADLDAAYRRYLVGSAGIDHDRALAVINDLAQFIEKGRAR
jgi:hypothetical protein